MATAIPSSMTFEMLSRLPPNSFVQVWKEIRPSVAPQNNQYTVQSNGTQRVNFVIRGAPNEFLLNTNCYLAGSAYTKSVLDLNTSVTDAQVNRLLTYPPTRLGKPLHFFQSSRESFNSGSLPFLDNQDTVASHEINELRASFTQRNQPRMRGEQTLEDCDSWLDSADTYQTKLLTSGLESLAYAGGASRFVYRKGGMAPYTYYASPCGKNKDFRVPLGVYSNLVNSHSVIPIGLMSSYSVNGWQLDLDITNQSSSNGKVFQSDGQFQLTAADGEVPATFINVEDATAVIADLRIYACIIRVLDPSVMEAVLSLYEKREMVNVGGVQFPLSLRLNSLGYRFSRFPLSQPQTDYYFRITGTDRSVRALAWRVFSQSRNSVGAWSLTRDLVCTRLETMIGSELPHPVVEDMTPATTNVSNFVALNIKRSGALFSALPYYQEGVKHDGDASDGWMTYNNALVGFDAIQTVEPETGASLLNVRRCLCQGLISFENLDRREGDFSGSFQASGKDLTNVGAIELRMRFQKCLKPQSLTIPTVDLADQLTFGPLTSDEQDYQIVFSYVYDSVMEVSPQGVMDITNATL